MNRQLAIATIAYLLLCIWSASYFLSCISLVIPLFVFTVIFKNSYILKKKIKICTAKCLFKESSWIYNLLTKKLIIIISSIFISLILTISLSLAIIHFTIFDFIIFGLDIIFLIVLYNKILSSQIINDNIKLPIVQNSASWINSIVFAFLLTIISFNQTPPEYIDINLENSVKKASVLTQSNCEVINYGSRIVSEVSATKWWFMLGYSNKIKNNYIKILVWFVFLFGNYLAIFAFSRYILGLIEFSTNLKGNNESK